MHYLFLNLFQSPDLPEGETVQESQNLIDLIASGGPIGVAIVGILLVLSIAAVAIFIERWFTIQRA
ncbi:MAG: hypothetical protein WAT79_04035 [Saprospiraceae bacterium]